MDFVKGHGTENDFVLVPDLDGRLELGPLAVRAICDRRAGVGGDGLLRVVRCAPDAPARFFMDYRNADGSVAEMCGNGIRVFARYLVDAGLAEAGELLVETRGGVRKVRVGVTGDVTVGLGPYALPQVGPVTVGVPGGSWPAVAVRMPNPHLVAFVDDLTDAGDLLAPPVVTPADTAPDGANVELVVVLDERHLAMRVHERGVGETRSCGTGAAAAAVATGLRTGALPASGPVDMHVDVPGGSLVVTVHPDDQVDLTGPAVLVASGTLDPDWLRPLLG